MSLQEYLELCKDDPNTYATAAERMLAAIGEPELIDTRKDPRLSRIFSNKVIKVYPAFKDFYGMEETIEQIVSYFKHAAQGLEEKKQILYLLGPVGGGKSSLAEKLKSGIPIQSLATWSTEVVDRLLANGHVFDVLRQAHEFIVVVVSPMTEFVSERADRFVNLASCAAISSFKERKLRI